MGIWTGVSRELYDNKLSAIGFVGENGEHIRVSVDVLEQFFDNNDISNMVYSKTKQSVDTLEITMSCLDTYRCTSRGRCSFVQGIGEDQILNLAMPNINKFKAIQDKIKSAKDKQKKREDAAKKLAIAATVVGVTATGVKTIGKNIENSASKEIKQLVYKRLRKYYRLLSQLVDSKYTTNAKIQKDTSIVSYTRTIEALSIQNKELRQDILKYGILQYTKNIQTLISLSLEPVIKYGLMDDTLRDIGAETSIRMYTASLYSKIDKIKELHNKTKELIEINAEAHREFLANKMKLINSPEQVKLLEEVETCIKYIEQVISNEINNSTEQDIRNSLGKLSNIDINSIRIKINKLINPDTQDEYLDYIYSLETIILDYKTRLGVKLREFNDQHTHSIESSIDDLCDLMIDIQKGTYTSKEIVGVKQYLVDELKELKNKIDKLSIEVRNNIEHKLNKLNKIYQSTENILQVKGD